AIFWQGSAIANSTNTMIRPCRATVISSFGLPEFWNYRNNRESKNIRNRVALFCPDNRAKTIRPEEKAEEKVGEPARFSSRKRSECTERSLIYSLSLNSSHGMNPENICDSE